MPDVDFCIIIQFIIGISANMVDIDFRFIGIRSGSGAIYIPILIS